MGGTCSTHGTDEKRKQILVGKPEGRRELGTNRRRCEDSIEMHITGMGHEDVYWIHLAQNEFQ